MSETILERDIRMMIEAYGYEAVHRRQRARTCVPSCDCRTLTTRRRLGVPVRTSESADDTEVSRPRTPSADLLRWASRRSTRIATRRWNGGWR